MSDPTPICITCHKEMRCEENGVLVLRMKAGIPHAAGPHDYGGREPYSIRAADLYKCPNCWATQPKGFGDKTIYNHEPEFAQAYEIWQRQGPEARIWYS